VDESGLTFLNANYLSLIKSRSLIVVLRKILGIKTIKNSETSNHIVRILVDVFQKLIRKLI
jgi:hypothetical protein